MEPGVSVDIVSLRPMAGSRRRVADRAEKRVLDEAELRARAEDLALGFSDDGERFRELVQARLVTRVLELIRDDPEACGYQKIIADMGHRFNAAKTAVDKLYRGYMGKD